jgi:hypothetical protein
MRTHSSTEGITDSEHSIPTGNSHASQGGLNSTHMSDSSSKSKEFFMRRKDHYLTLQLKHLLHLLKLKMENLKKDLEC